MAPALWAVWGSLAVLVAAIVGGGAYAGTAGLGAWRRLKRTSRMLGAGGEALSRRAEEAASRAGGASGTGARLAASTARLQRSLAYAQVVAGAAGSVGATVSRIRGALPRK